MDPENVPEIEIENPPAEIVTMSMEESPKKEIKLLRTVEDIQERRQQVLKRYAEFKVATQSRRKRLEDAKRLFQFKRDADEVEVWINDKMEIALDECYKDTTNLQVWVTLYCNQVPSNIA